MRIGQVRWAKFAILSISAFIVFVFALESVQGSRLQNFLNKSRARGHKNGDDTEGTRWAILIAGSAGYWNYRHQADICHAYQVLKRGGLKDENIIVFMYDDIAHNKENPFKGVIINRPGGENVYEGVPKDYTGANVTADNFYAAILGDKKAIKGGSGKVLATNPNDHIFIYFSDHGGPGELGMPDGNNILGTYLVKVLRKKAATKSFKSLVFYLEACESGSIFQGEALEELNIYATTAANGVESSWGAYCPGDDDTPSSDYDTCLGDQYSVAWMEDTEVENRHVETLHTQYEIVKKRVNQSHVQEFGDKNLGKRHLDEFMGNDPSRDHQSLLHLNVAFDPLNVVEQRDADLLYFKRKVQKARENSEDQVKAQKELDEYLAHRSHVDTSVRLVGEMLFGFQQSEQILQAVRPQNQRLVDDSSCFKGVKKAFEANCGSLHDYGMKHSRAFANICNAGIGEQLVAQVSARICPTFPSNRFSSLKRIIELMDRNCEPCWRHCNAGDNCESHYRQLQAHWRESDRREKYDDELLLTEKQEIAHQLESWKDNFSGSGLSVVSF